MKIIKNILDEEDKKYFKNKSWVSRWQEEDLREYQSWRVRSNRVRKIIRMYFGDGK